MVFQQPANGWYIAGNLVFGGLIGWFIVDPFGGKMYSISQKEINATLSQKSTKNGDESDGNFELKFVLISDVPESLRSKMKALNQ